MRYNKTVIALLVIVALLLAANLIVHLAGSVQNAEANIVEGKNIFSTNEPDGKTVYLWGYTQAGSLNNVTVNGFYYGKITLEGYAPK